MRKYQSEATVRSYQKMKADAKAGDPDAIARYEAHLAKRRDEYHQKSQKGGYSGMNEPNPNLNKANKEVTMELNFIKSGDYYIPDIKLKNPNIRLGKWGRMRREYLRQAHPIVFSEMVLSETLYEHCAEIEATAKKRMDDLAAAYEVLRRDGATESREPN